MRISGINIPDNKRLEIGLTAVFGVGRPKASEVLENLKIEKGKKPKDLTEQEENNIRKAVENLNIEGNLRRDISTNIKRLKDISSYRGSRHIKKLPTKGQRTKTNARTLKGVKKTMGSGRKRATDKK